MTKNPDIFYEKMYFFLTIGVLIYIFVRIWIYLYKLSFLEIEKQNIDISKLQVWDTLEKVWYEKYISNVNKNIINKKIENISELTNLQEYLSIQTPPVVSIKILKTFAFAPIIFFGFMLNYFYGNTLLSVLFELFKKILFPELY